MDKNFDTICNDFIDQFYFKCENYEMLQRKDFFYKSFKALNFNQIDGDYLEFGCHEGVTFILAYNEAKRFNYKCHHWGFDSFEGLPEPEKGLDDDHPAWKKGALSFPKQRFIERCDRAGLGRNDYTLVKGFYDKTLTKFSKNDYPKNIALAYVDCVMYSSTKLVLDFLMPRLKHGMIIAFDDYFCWSPTEMSGERKAMLEYFSDNKDWNLVPFLQCSWGVQSFVVEKKR